MNGVELDTGCYVAGHWGQYGPSRLLRIADDILGTSFYEEAQNIRECRYCGSERMGDDHESMISEIADEAEMALNDATPVGHLWHWSDGELFLSPLCDDDDACDDDTCACHTW